MSSLPFAPIRRTVHYSGRVQGVGFRYTTEAIATRFRVAGYVRNLPDGRVELVVEGTTEELDRFQQAISTRMAGFIQDEQARTGAATGEFTSFGIAY